MTKLSKFQINAFAQLTDEQLRAEWEAIGTRPYHRTKAGANKGQIKLVWIKYSDKILAELKRRTGFAL